MAEILFFYPALINYYNYGQVSVREIFIQAQAKVYMNHDLAFKHTQDMHAYMCLHIHMHGQCFFKPRVLLCSHTGLRLTVFLHLFPMKL